MSIPATRQQAIVAATLGIVDVATPPSGRDYSRQTSIGGNVVARRASGRTAFVAAGFLALTATAHADVYSKANNPNPLDTPSSYTLGITTTPSTVVPGGTDLVQWNNLVTAANSVSTGAGVTFGEIQILNPGGGVTITAGAGPLTLNGLNGVGIDLTAATQNLTITSPLTLGGPQAWNVGSGRTFTYTGTALSAGANLLTIGGAGNTTIGASNAPAGLSSTGGITKVGAGTLTINGGGAANANNIGTSTLSANGGITNLFTGATSGTSAVLNNAANVSLGGGAFTYTFTANGNNQGLANLAIAAGESVAFANRNGGFNSSLSFTGTVTRSIGATLAGRPYDSSRQATFLTGLAQTTLLTSNGTAYATLGNNTNLTGGVTVDNQQDWAALDSSKRLIAATYTATTATALGTSAQNANVAAATTTLAANTVIASLRDNVNQATTIELNGKTLQTGGILVPSAVATAGSSIKDSVGTGSLTGPAGSDLTLLISANAVTPVPFTISAKIVDNLSGNVGTALTKGAPGTLILSGNNTFTNGLYINDGTVQLGNAGALNSTTPNAINFGGSGFVTGIANTSGGATGGTLSSAPTLSLAGNSVAVASLSTANNFSGVAPIVQNANANSATLTLNSSGATPTVFNGTIQNGTGVGTLSVVKTGSSTATIGGALSYTGTTTVSGGTLVLTSTPTASSTITAGTVAAGGSGASLNVAGLAGGTLTLTNSQTLAGTGSVTGSVTAASGAIISPGSSTSNVDTLSITNGLTLSNGSISNFEFSASANDVIAVAGALSLAATDGVNLFQAGTVAKFTTPGTYTLFTFGTQTVGLPSNLSVLNPTSGLTYSFADVGNALQLTITGSAGISAAWNVDADGNYSTAANWNPQTVPNAAGATATFGGVITAPRTVTIDAPVTVGEIDFNNVNAYTLAADGANDAITFNNSGNAAVVSDQLGSHTIAAPVVIAGQGATNPGLSIVVATAGNVLTLSNSIGETNGAAVVTKSGPGTLALTGVNTYTGGTTITGGVVQINTAASLGETSGVAALNSTTAAVTLEALQSIITTRNFNVVGTNNTIQVDGANATYEIDGIIANGVSAGALMKSGPGTLALAGNNSYTGSTTISAGTLALGNGTTAGSGSVAGAIVNNAALSLNRPINDDYALGNTITGTGTLTQNGGNNVTLTAANTFTGNTSVTAGTLTVGNALAMQNSTLNYNNQGGTFSFGTQTAVTLGGLSGSQTLALTNTATTPAAVALSVGGSNATSSYTGTLGGLGSMTKNGTGTFTIGTGTNGGASYAGTTTVNQGTLVLGGVGSLSGQLAITGQNGVSSAVIQDTAIINSSGALLVNGASSQGFPSAGTLLVKNSASVTVPSVSFGTGTASRVATGSSITVQDSASLIVNGAVDFINTFGGTTTVAQTSVNLNGGTLAAQQFQLTNFGAATASSSAALRLNGGTLKALTGDASASAFFLPALTRLTASVDAGGALIDTNGFDITIAQPLVHGTNGTGGVDGGLTKSGVGTLTLAAPNSYTGVTTISAGTLAINGQFALGGAAYGGTTFNGGTLRYAANFSGNGSGDITQNSAATPVAKNVTIAAGGATIDTNGNTVTFNNSLGNNGAGALTKTGAGTLVLKGAGTYAGGTNINGGTVRADATTSLGGGTVTVNNGVLAGAAGTGTGAVNVTGVGTITAGTGANAGDTPGSLAAGGNTTIATGGKYAWKVSSTANAPTAGAGTNWDLLSLSSLNVAGGAVLVVTAGNATPTFTPGQSFEIATAGAATNGATNTAVDNTNSAALQAFANLFTVALNGLGGYSSTDFTLTAQANAGGPSGVDLFVNYQMQATPEPTTVALFGLGLSPMLCRRRSRRAAAAVAA